MEKNNSDTQLALWEVFLQQEQGGPHVHAGSLHASDPEMALMNARDVYARRGPVLSIWVVPSTFIIATTPAETGYFFDPAEDKIYRHPQFYKVPKGVRNI